MDIIQKSKEFNKNNNESDKIYDLEERTYLFARRVNSYVSAIPKTMSNLEVGKQLIRSGGSVGSNYIEANESLSKKDFRMRIKICKKESKESRFWLKLSNPDYKCKDEKKDLVRESTELMKIFASILEKS